MRTIFRIAAGFLLCVSIANAAQKTPEIDEKQIFTTVTPMNQEDETAVLVFFKFSCPVCRNYHAMLDRWGATLPKPFLFQFVPVAEGDGQNDISMESGLGMLGFWSAEMSGNHEQRNTFAENMYSLYQDRHIQITPAEVVSSASSSRIPMTLFQKAWAYELKDGTPGLARQLHYRPVATPTMVVCGKYMITPDNALGNPETFIQLANALVSKCMIEKGMRK